MEERKSERVKTYNIGTVWLSTRCKKTHSSGGEKSIKQQNNPVWHPTALATGNLVRPSISLQVLSQRKVRKPCTCLGCS